MAMKEAVKKILRTETIINLFTNAILNALCAFLINMRAETVATDFFSVAIDMFITCHCTAMLTTGFAVFSARRYKKLGVYTEDRWASGFPKNPVLLGLVIADIFFFVGLALGGIFALCTVTTMPLWIFVLYKGIFGAVIGIVAVNVAQRRFLLREDAA